MYHRSMTNTTDTDTIAAMYPVMVTDTIVIDGGTPAVYTYRRGTRATVAQQYARHVAGVIDSIRRFSAPADLQVIGGENETYLDWTEPDGSRVSRTVAVRPAD